MKTEPLRLALVGAGAVSQLGYLPALASVPEVHCRFLVDVDKELAAALAKKWKIPEFTDDYDRALEAVEAVVLAVPNHLHAPFSLKALEAGKAVLCEKPLARSFPEARTMAETARRKNVPLTVGMILRQNPGLRLIRRAFPWEELGKIESISAAYGHPLDWPMSSLYLFDRQEAGGGALLDQGVHLLDALFWILSVREADVISYADDGESGLEAEAEGVMSLRLEGKEQPVDCRFEVSRVRAFRNGFVVKGEKAQLRAPFSSSENPVLTRKDGSLLREMRSKGTPDAGFFEGQLKSFAEQVRNKVPLLADGESQLLVLKTVDDCYARRTPLRRPWQEHEPWK
jgi:predicted dehydrogenase